MAAVPRSGTPEKPSALPAADPAGGDAAPGTSPGPDSRRSARRLLAAAAAVLVVALLAVAYLQMSRTYPENSDESNDLLMAWDMLHGNVLLHGWYLSDVSFITTELPQYLLLERFFGLHTDTAHIAAAMTYTLVVVLAVLLARGPAYGNGASGNGASGNGASGNGASGNGASGNGASGNGAGQRQTSRREAAPRMLLTAAVMFAPQLGVGVFVLLLSLGHIGTAVPLMLTWLVIDRLRPRWWVPVITGLLLTWVLAADPLVLIVGIIPLVAVCAVRVARELSLAQRRGDPSWARAVLRAHWYELSLAVTAILAYGLASVVARVLRASGGFFLHPVPYQLAPVHTWPKHAWVTGEGLLALFGAKPQGPAAALAFAVLHLAGVALVAWAMARVARQFLSWPDMISQILLVAMVINVVAYVPSTLANATDLNAREFAIVLPFGAVLAGRTLAPALLAGLALRRWHRAVPALLVGALLAGYGASLGYAAAQPSVPPANARLAAFLAAHHLTSGIGGYWESSVVTVGSDGAVTIRAVLPGTLQPDLWEAKGSWYASGPNRATFLVTDSAPGFFNHWQPSPAALAALGLPIRTYRVGPYTVYVWDKNLLAGLGHP